MTILPRETDLIAVAAIHRCEHRPGVAALDVNGTVPKVLPATLTHLAIEVICLDVQCHPAPPVLPCCGFSPHD